VVAVAGVELRWALLTLVLAGLAAQGTYVL